MISGLEPQDRLHIFWHKDGILAFFPISAGRWRVIADLGPAKGDGHHADPTLEEVQALITLRGTEGIVIKDAVLARGVPHQRAQGLEIRHAAAPSWPAMPPISTARPAARA